MQEAVDAFLHEPFLPAPDAGLRLAGPAHDLVGANTVGVERMIAARQACFCEALRSLVIASSRPRTDRVIVMEIPVRMHQTCTATETEESQSGSFCQAKTTRSSAEILPRQQNPYHATRTRGVSAIGLAPTSGEVV